MGTVYDADGNVVITDDELLGLEDLIPNRILVWHDEFKDSIIDPEKWEHVYSTDYAKDLSLVTETGNGLKYRTIRDNRPDVNDYPWSSAELLTKSKFEFKYGRIEAKIKFPSNNPYHSTFWTLGACYDRHSVEEGVMYAEDGVKFPSCGEIDIAEFDNGSVGARMHWSTNGFDNSDGYTSGGNISELISTPTSWHIYSAEWTESAITFYVDGVQKGTWNISNGTVSGWNPFMHPHFIVLNCIPFVSGTPTWDIAETQVAWVRVYAPSGVSSYIPETGISIPASASVSIGGRYWLGTPTFTPSNPSDMTVKWLSHNPEIVTCYGGMLVGVSAGTTFVQATSKRGFAALCKVTVS